MDYEKFVTQSLTKASEIAEKNFGKVEGTTKTADNNQVLTETDVQIGKLLVGEIETAFPGHNVIDEEAGVIDKGSDYTWVVDPIDGTSNFVEGIPMYGILLGLLKRARPVVGGISLPSFSEIYYAEKDQGAYCNGERIQVTEKTELLESLVAYGIDGHQENPEFTERECVLLAKLILGIRNLRSSNSVYDFAMVAKGKYGGYLNQTSKIWDNVAAQVVIEEAGGTYTDFYGEPIDYSDPLSQADLNYTYCTASPVLHARLQEIIHG